MKILSSTPKCLKWLCSLIEKILCLTNIYPSNIPSIFLVNPTFLFVKTFPKNRQVSQKRRRQWWRSVGAHALPHCKVLLQWSTSHFWSPPPNVRCARNGRHESWRPVVPGRTPGERHLPLQGRSSTNITKKNSAEWGSPAPCRWRRRSPHLTSWQSPRNSPINSNGPGVLDWKKNSCKKHQRCLNNWRSTIFIYLLESLLINLDYSKN